MEMSHNMSASITVDSVMMKVTSFTAQYLNVDGGIVKLSSIYLSQGHTYTTLKQTLKVYVRP